MAKILYFNEFSKDTTSPTNKTSGLDDFLGCMQVVARYLNKPEPPFKKPEDYAFLRKPYPIKLY